jgi:hypothetical protein
VVNGGWVRVAQLVPGSKYLWDRKYGIGRELQ